MPESVGRYEVRVYNLKEARNKLQINEAKQKHCNDNHSGPEQSSIMPGQSCHFKKGRGTWIESKIITINSDRSYFIKSTQGLIFRRKREDIRLSTIVTQLEQPIQAHDIPKEQVSLELQSSVTELVPPQYDKNPEEEVCQASAVPVADPGTLRSRLGACCETPRRRLTVISWLRCGTDSGEEHYSHDIIIISNNTNFILILLLVKQS